MKLVVAIDGEQSASSALDFMVNEKYPAETEVHLVHVLAPGFADVGVEGIPDRAAEEVSEEQSVLKKNGAGFEGQIEYQREHRNREGRNCRCDCGCVQASRGRVCVGAKPRSPRIQSPLVWQRRR